MLRCKQQKLHCSYISRRITFSQRTRLAWMWVPCSERSALCVLALPAASLHPLACFLPQKLGDRAEENQSALISSTMFVAYDLLFCSTVHTHFMEVIY